MSSNQNTHDDKRQRCRPQVERVLKSSSKNRRQRSLTAEAFHRIANGVYEDRLIRSTRAYTYIVRTAVQSVIRSHATNLSIQRPLFKPSYVHRPRQLSVQGPSDGQVGRSPSSARSESGGSQLDLMTSTATHGEIWTDQQPGVPAWTRRCPARSSVYGRPPQIFSTYMDVGSKSSDESSRKTQRHNGGAVSTLH